MGQILDRQSDLIKMWPDQLSIRRRWTLLPFYSNENLTLLHDHEVLRARKLSTNQLVGGRRDVFEFQCVFDWVFEDKINREPTLNPFWLGKVEEDEKRARVLGFYSSVFPIWFNIIRKHYERYNINLVSGNKDAVVNEVEMLHEVDWAIYGSGYKVDRVSNEQWTKKVAKDAIDLRYKAAKGE